MLVRQAVLQVRVFVSGSPEIVLDDENQVRAAMSAAVDLGELIESAQQG
jgi:shikimate dehydrogenase